MATTTFYDGQTVIYSAWLNDVNNAVYNGNFPNGVLNATTVNATTVTTTNLTATNATITNLTAYIGTLVLTNNWSIVASASKLSFVNNGTTVATIDTSGNLKLLSSSITGTTP
jgi:hypothetical protein